MTKTVYCICGEKLTISGTPEGVKGGISFWRKAHQGDGHKLCDAKTWRKVKKG